MNRCYPKSFEPFKIGSLSVKNRYCVGPLGGAYFTAKGEFGKDAIDFYVQCAKGGFGLISTNGIAADVKVDDHNPLDRIFPLLNRKGFISSATFMTERVHSYGAKIFMQVTMGVGRNGTGKRLRRKLRISSRRIRLRRH